ncbi:CoA transferase [Gordonia sp. HNM0687]|uniref:CoA transferase n=1 Tax=Gordonia mangrovi TaxID=2665643 RepID=A0A6L7GU66_9ACTN|nr:CaiB/BaiF CoA-transferase family protein [Gordonia mangrovi]MXP23486.1 CoA transferase [Gordonia mangrovi]UVF76619.1 CoA transferase [Gordonia mangrovi]
MSNTNHPPLRGIKVLDLSRILAAPLAAQMLGDLGADVIKVERPSTGDDSRSYGPPFLTDENGEESDEAGFYLSCNRNKRSITVDHSTPEGADVIRRLAADADVLIENFRTGVLAKYGLDFESLRANNPRLVYCSITGFGQDGPYARRPGYDGIFQAMSGMMSVSGIPDGEPGAGPMKMGVSMVDVLTSLYASNAIVAALWSRDHGDGAGQHIDISLLDCGLASLSHYAQNYLVSGVAAPRRGNGGFGGIPSQTFTGSDGEEFFLVASTPKQWQGVTEVIERPDLLEDERFGTVSARIANRDLVLQTLRNAFGARPAHDWVVALEAKEVPVSPVNDMDGVFANPQIAHRDMRMRLDHPVSGTVDLLRNPIMMSDTPLNEYRTPPMLGEHTREILAGELGMTDTQIDKLIANKAV